jgi:dTDP-4-dehydrorhamnose 3,5-epimerase
MKVLGVTRLAIPEICVVRFGRFKDQRGYFTEPYRRSDAIREVPQLREVTFVQQNESFSHAGTIRGMHFQWNPYMGKLVRTVVGHMVDLVLDIRLGSPTFGKILAYDMPADRESDAAEWIWVPPGFAHGNYFPQDSIIEYLCSGEYSQGCEACIGPLSADLDWSLCDPALADQFQTLLGRGPIISDKDRAGMSLAAWQADGRASNFRYAAT